MAAGIEDETLITRLNCWSVLAPRRHSLTRCVMFVYDNAGRSMTAGVCAAGFSCQLRSAQLAPSFACESRQPTRLPRHFGGPLSFPHWCVRARVCSFLPSYTLRPSVRPTVCADHAAVVPSHPEADVVVI